MIKIEKGFSSKTHKSSSLLDLAKEHYDRVLEKNRTYVSPLTKLEEKLLEIRAIVPQTDETILKIRFLEKVTARKEFKKLLTSSLDKFQDIINDYQEFNSLFENKKYKDYLELFGYSRLRGLRLMYTLAMDLGIKTCPYCNNNYILTIKKSKKANLHFDHFYSKSEYPYLSLNFYNLIPCCAVCNTAKSDKKFDFKDYIHPYFDSLSNKFDFTTDGDSIFDMILDGSKDLTKMKVRLAAKNGYSGLVEKHDNVFNLSEVFNEHSDVVYEVYAKQYIYTDEFKELLLDNFQNQFSKEEMERFLLGNYSLESEINKRPLAKLMQDIQKEAKKAIESSKTNL
ncbi:HNH endonuclease [Nonlabens sp. Asnod3-H03]|uniref:HNH endonuclease n=1 Tax=Nonlabens sp. Asnod3-H03 TaxID=3160580 RepID=UPI0038669CDC